MSYSSGYFLGLCNKFRNSANSYNKKIRELQNIKDKLTNSFDDEKNSVNNKMSNLSEDLNAAIQGNSVVYSNFDIVTNNYLEQNVYSDGYLNQVINSLENEIFILQQKKYDCDQKCDYYNNEYNKKYNEEQNGSC